MTLLPRMICLLLAVSLAPLCVAGGDVFDEADRLRRALLEKDMTHLRSLDKTGDILTEEGQKFLFDPAWMTRVSPGMQPLRDIVAAAHPVPLVEKIAIDGRPVYYLYWVVPAAGGAVVLEAGQWMRTVAACALAQDADGAWAFHRHLCFDETEGPFVSGANR